MIVNRWQLALVLYALFIGLILLIKPALMFTADGNIKQWSTENTEASSIFSPMIVFPMLGFLSYYLGIWLELLFSD
jgi:hypothetical protein